MAESSIRSSESSIPKKGGYDLDFVYRVPGRYMCTICSKPFHKPHVTECCGKHFCETCLQSEGKKKKRCPNLDCGAEGKKFKHIIHKGLQGEILKLKVRCIHHRERCRWEGKLDDLETHLNNDSRSDISEGCRYVTVNCPNGCNEKDIKRKNLSAHLSQCPYLNGRVHVECPYKDVGCRANFPSQHKCDQHMTENIQQHMDLVMRAFQDMKRDNQRLKQRIERLEEKQSKGWFS